MTTGSMAHSSGQHRPDGPFIRPAVLRGRGLGGGVAEGEALVSREAIAGWGGIDPRTGTIIESRHELEGQSMAGKILIFPSAKGSSGWSGVFHLARLEGAGPRAMVFNVMNTKVALAVVVSHAPCVTALDRDPTEVVRTGDLVRVDGDRGTVEILRRAEPGRPGEARAGEETARGPSSPETFS